MPIHRFVPSAILLLVISQACFAEPDPATILADAASYTVKVETLTTVALHQDEEGASSGTGFLIDSQRGWLLTNSHVASRSPGSVSVSFQNGQRISARRIHVDTYIDFAVLAISPALVPAGAKEASLACESTPVAGTSVLAYGHPWGLSFTATRGIISGLAWFYPSLLIQTDAVINSGNSGGPLISLADGLVVGINTATYNPTRGEEGDTAISLAEPMPAICRVLDLLKSQADTRVRLLPVALGVSGDDLRPRVADVFAPGLDLQSGDIVVSVNGGELIHSLPDLFSQLRDVGTNANLGVQRGGQLLEVQVPTRIVPDPLSLNAINLSGLIIADPWQLDDIVVNPRRDLVVHWYESDQEVALTGVEIFDYVVSVNGKKYNSVAELYEYLSGLPDAAGIDIMLRRTGSGDVFAREYLHITVPKTELNLIPVESEFSSTNAGISAPRPLVAR